MIVAKPASTISNHPPNASTEGPEPLGCPSAPPRGSAAVGFVTQIDLSSDKCHDLHL